MEEMDWTGMDMLSVNLNFNDGNLVIVPTEDNLQVDLLPSTSNQRNQTSGMCHERNGQIGHMVCYLHDEMPRQQSRVNQASFIQNVVHFVNILRNSYPPLYGFIDEENFMLMVEMLVETGMDINEVDKNGDSILFKAIIHGKSVAELKKLVDLGGSWNTTNAKGDTVLHLVADTGHLEAMKYFISKGADVNAINRNGETLLTRAEKSAGANNAKILKILKKNRI